MSLFVCIVTMCVISAVTVTGQPGTSLRVIQKGLELNHNLSLRCDGMNSTHPLAKGSWLITYASGEEKQIVGAMDGWAFRLSEEMNGARVACRSHALPQRQLVSVSPGFEIRIQDAEPPQAETFRDVTMKITNTTYAKGEQLVGSEGEEIEVCCEGMNLPKDKLYMYILQRKEDVEWEVAAVLQTNSRLAEASARLTLRDSSHFTQLYCLARWFTNNTYDEPRGLRSKPVTISMNNATTIQLASSSTRLYLWIAVGVGCLGWLLAVFLLVVLYLRKSALNSSTDSTEMRSTSRTLGWCVRVKSAIYAEPAGATVVPAESARSLMAANIKLSPPGPRRSPPGPHRSPPPGPQRSLPNAPNDEVTYSNLEELSALTRKRYI